MSDTAAERERTVPREDIDAEWAALFPFDPYPQQVDGVESARETFERGGYLLLEGACGTGKTLIALVAGLQAVADEHAERVMAVTPVKQQLRQFVTEVRAVNAARADRDADPVDGLVMVGKRDLLPYARTDALGDGSVHDASSDMRERTATLVSRESDLELDVARVAQVLLHVHLGVAERVLRLGAGHGDRVGQRRRGGRCADLAHAADAAVPERVRADHQLNARVVSWAGG